VGVVNFDLRAQSTNVDIHGSCFDIDIAAPYESEQFFATVNPHRVAQEKREYVELTKFQLALLIVRENLIRIKIDTQPTLVKDPLETAARLEVMRPRGSA
jgi:hypothetical protein